MFILPNEVHLLVPTFSALDHLYIFQKIGVWGLTQN